MEPLGVNLIGVRYHACIEDSYLLPQAVGKYLCINFYGVETCESALPTRYSVSPGDWSIGFVYLPRGYPTEESEHKHLNYSSLILQ